MIAESGSSGTDTIDPVAAGEDYVIAALRRLHCTIVRRISEGGGPSPVEAWKANEHMLMRVEVAVAPDEPHALTPLEEKELRQLALRANAEPWVAAVVLGPDLELLQLDWRPLE